MVYEDKMKCMACRLHFIIYSDQEPHRVPESVYCPECGTKGASLRLSKVEHPGAWVYQFVSA